MLAQLTVGMVAVIVVLAVGVAAAFYFNLRKSPEVERRRKTPCRGPGGPM